MGNQLVAIVLQQLRVCDGCEPVVSPLEAVVNRGFRPPRPAPAIPSVHELPVMLVVELRRRLPLLVVLLRLSASVKATWSRLSAAAPSSRLQTWL